MTITYRSYSNLSDACSNYLTPTEEQKERLACTDGQDSSESDTSRNYNRIVAKAMEEFRQCEECQQPFLQDAAGSAYSMICTWCSIATREMNPIQKIAEAIRIEEPMLDKIANRNRQRLVQLAWKPS
jgi:hypothetical protein